MGAQKDYLIIRAVVTTADIKKYFYFSNDGGVTFGKLPPVDEFIAGKADATRGMFSGNPQMVIRLPGDPTPEEEEEEEQEEEEDEEGEDNDDPDAVPKAKKPKRRKFYEVERLAHVCKAIEQDVCVVPLGQFYLTSTREICKNRDYNGMSIDTCKNLQSYLLYRNPTHENTLQRVRKYGITNNRTFLDCIADAAIPKAWCLHQDESGVNFTLRSLLWPGYEFKITAGLFVFFSLSFFYTTLFSRRVVAFSAAGAVSGSWTMASS